MRLKTTTDWQLIYKSLLDNSKSLSPNDQLDAFTMLLNLDNMINELSKLEVSARQSKKYRNYTAALEKINEEIDHVENLIFMGVLAT